MTSTYPAKCVRIPSGSLVLMLTCVLLFATPAVRAASGTWTNGAGTSIWSTAATGNWASGIVADGSTSTATFSLNTAANQTILLDGARTINLISITNANATPGTWTLSNNGNAANILTLAGTNAGIDIPYDADWTAARTISAVIAGTDGLRLTGGGSLTLTGANTYTGVTSITGGILTVSTLANGGVASGIGAASNARSNLAFSLSGVGNIGGLTYTGATTTIDRGFSISNVNARAWWNVSQATSTLTVTGGISGLDGSSSTVGNLEKYGVGRLILTGTDLHTGTTTAVQGTLQFGRQVALYNNNTGNWNATNLIVSSGATMAFNVGGTGEFTSANIDTLKALGTASGGFRSGSFLGFDTTNDSDGTFTYASNITNPNSGSNVLGLKKFGSNTLVLGGTSTYTGGTHLLGGKLSISQDSNLGGAVGTLTFDGGTLLNSESLTMNRGTTLNSGGGTFEVAATKTLTQQGVITGGGTLSKTGAGTLTLSGANNYVGSTLVTEGTLVISGTGSIANSAATVSSGATLNVNGTAGTVAVNSNGTLTGAGTLGATTIVGHHSPGNSPGIQNFASNLTYTNGSSVTWELIANTDLVRGTNFDGINVVGDLTITGTSTINLVFNLGGSSVVWANSFWDTDKSWLFYDVGGSLSGAFALGTLSVDSLGQVLGVDRGSFSIGYNGSDVSILYTAIPEPSTTLLLTAGLMAVVLLRRRARSE